ncbi:MAG TPA: hypothetical protein VF559_06075 [Caulobacteraceae bacterium]|jgi:hypothetical protein
MLKNSIFFTFLLVIGVAETGSVFGQIPQPAPAVAAYDRGVAINRAEAVYIFRGLPGSTPRQKLGYVMKAYTEGLQAAVQLSSNRPVFSWMLEDDALMVDGQRAVMLSLTASTKEWLKVRFPHLRPCTIGKDYAVGGIGIFPNGDQTVEVRVLDADQPVVKKICNSLGQNISGLSPTEEGNEEGLSRYELYAGEYDALQIVLHSGAVAESSLYWKGLGLPSPLSLSDEDSSDKEEMVGFGTELLSSGHAVMQADSISPEFVGVTSDSFTPQARAVFGVELDKLQGEWTHYISTTGYTIRPNLLPASQIGSPSMWKTRRNLNKYIRSLNCVAVRFATEHKYFDPRDSNIYGQCVSAWAK